MRHEKEGFIQCLQLELEKKAVEIENIISKNFPYYPLAVGFGIILIALSLIKKLGINEVCCRLMISLLAQFLLWNPFIYELCGMSDYRESQDTKSIGMFTVLLKLPNCLSNYK